MRTKSLPFTKSQIERIIQTHPTPFHLYDEQGIRLSARDLGGAFSWAPGFKEYFAVKATPNPYILRLLKEEGCGVDCSSLAELVLAEKVGLAGEEIMFSSNNTPAAEYVKARELGAIINLDDLSHLDFLARHTGMPETICFRYNPGPLRGGNAIIGVPQEAKYGLTREQLLQAYPLAREMGARRFGLHTMVVSNELDPYSYISTAEMLFDLAAEIKAKTGINIEFVNFGGGIGIPYRPEDEPVDLNLLSREIAWAYQEKIERRGLHPVKINMELGRLMTGPFGYLIATAIHKKETYRNYIGLDASMANLMRPGMYGAYHHLSVLGKEDWPCDHVYDVTGSLCENNDKFAINRPLPPIDRGDIVVIHDTGAHGHAMGFNYNGKLRSAELLLRAEGEVQLIRRAETLEDYFATLDFSGL